MPEFITKEPLDPEVETSPELAETIPEFPERALPEINDTVPLAPPESPDPDATITAPVDDDESPLMNDTAPLLPKYAEPEAKRIAPLGPLEVVPELNSIDPEIPIETEFAERIETIPEEELTPLPLSTKIEPPVALWERVCPAENTAAPPLPLLVALTSMEIEPLMPDVALPVLKMTEPEVPETDDPVLIMMVPGMPTPCTEPVLTKTFPELPEYELPEDINKDPDTPLFAEFDDRMNKEPDDDAPGPPDILSITISPPRVSPNPL